MEKKQKKEQMQDTLNVEGYVATLEKQLNEGFKGTIVSVTPATNKEYFDSDAYDTRDGIKISVVVEDGQKTEFNNWLSLPNIRGYEKSNLFAFKKKYGSVPKVNLIVDVIIDEDGFFRIKY